MKYGNVLEAERCLFDIEIRFIFGVSRGGGFLTFCFFCLLNQETYRTRICYFYFFPKPLRQKMTNSCRPSIAQVVGI